MKIFLVAASIQEQDIFKLALDRVVKNVDFSLAFTCEEAQRSLQDSKKPLPDFIFLDIDTITSDIHSCLCKLATEAVAQIPVILYTESKQTEAVTPMPGEGTRSRLYKSRDFRTFCHDLKLILSESSVN